MSSININTISDILDKGVIEPICNSCCPNCGNVYFFGGVYAFSNFSNIGIVRSELLDVGQCCTNSCLPQLEEYIGGEKYQLLLEKGILEYSLIGNESFVCNLLQQAEEGGLSGTALYDVIDMILTKGLVIFCDGDLKLTSSVETFLKYIESAYPSGFPLTDICCFTLTCETETYLAFIEAAGD